LRDNGSRREQEIGNNHDPGDRCDLHRLSRAMGHQHKERDARPMPSNTAAPIRCRYLSAK
jgi:hypothetical protein